MHKFSYLLLIILALLAMLDGIAAEYISGQTITTWSLISIWMIFFLIGAGAHQRLESWSIENIAELVLGMLLIHFSARVISNIALLPPVVAIFVGTTCIASRKMMKTNN